jgi:hypothetical protein
MNLLNLPAIPIDPAKWTPVDYERVIDKDRKEKGLKPKRARE